ncbi:WhiB family transcriptional regulator [Pseudonocardia sp. S2-4]|uniref:Transcriptional regulator WhiB n=1 Tax=Pseudonocardia humida TaxID=2800819 RepID=A0ABT1A784_9PSEU|nr:WhiB family transcriptional regulator [Pseudonocardia humida]
MNTDMPTRSWRERAACRGEDPELFFPSAESGTAYREQVAAAKAVCARCQVVDECLAEALARIPYGIAGGLTEHERRRLAGQRGRSRRGAAVVPVVVEVDVEEVVRVGRPAEVTSAGRALVAAGRPLREVARRCEVSMRTAQRWAAACRSVRAGGMALVVFGLLLGGAFVCSCECMTCALGQHCGACRTGSYRLGSGGWRS